jgi:hypothetical protein
VSFDPGHHPGGSPQPLEKEIRADIAFMAGYFFLVVVFYF